MRQVYNRRDPTSVDTTTRLKVRAFAGGDGYTQGMPDGINFVQKVFSLSWENLFIAEAQDIENFLIINAGKSFDWTEPGGNLYIVRCVDYSMLRDKPEMVTMTAQFEQVFV